MKCDYCGKEITKYDIATKMVVPVYDELVRITVHAICGYKIRKLLDGEEEDTYTVDEPTVSFGGKHDR